MELKVQLKLFFGLFLCTFVHTYEVFTSSLKNTGSSLQDLNSGVQVNFKNITRVPISIRTIAAYNTAASQEETSNSGNQILFVDSTPLSLSHTEFNSSILAVKNQAQSSKKAISGSQTIFPTITNSSIKVGSYSFANEAVVEGGDSGENLLAMSGVQTKVDTVAGSEIYATRFDAIAAASGNIATGKLSDSDAISGVNNDIGVTDWSTLQFVNVASNNTASTINGSAVAGVSNSLGNVSQSNVMLSSEASNNVAVGQGDDVIAGVKNNVQRASGQETNFVTNDVAHDNVANSTNTGNAIAGIYTNLGTIENINKIQLEGVAVRNNASVYGKSGETMDAIAGIDVSITDIKGSNLSTNFISVQNKAYNYHNDPMNESDAVSGTRLTIGNQQEAYVDISMYAYNNTAFALYGDAISGNELDVANGTNRTFVQLTMEDADNKAYSANGDAIIGSITNLP